MMRYKYWTPSGSVTHILSDDAIYIGPHRGDPYRSLTEYVRKIFDPWGRIVIPIDSGFINIPDPEGIQCI